MTASTLITDYLGNGLASARPSSLTIAATALGIYKATDTGALSFWYSAAWHTAGGVTSVVAGAGLNGGTITATGTIDINFGTIAGTAAQGNDARIVGAEQTANKGVASGYAGLDGSGKVPTAQLPASVIGALTYQGTWNATTNSPALASGTGTTGFYYVVGTAGTTTIDGVSIWNVGDWIAFDGTKWDKLDGQANPVTSVAGRQGAVTLAAADVSGLNGIATQSAPASGPIYSNGTILQTLTLGPNLSFSAGTLSVSGGSGSVTSVATGAGLSGGPITTAGTLVADWHGGTVAALGVNLAINTGTIDLITLPTSDPAVTGKLWVTTTGQVASSGTPPTLPLGFIIPGKPGASQSYNLPMAASVVIPASLTGAVTYDASLPTADSVFAVNKIAGGTTITSLGTITIQAATHTSKTLSGAGGTLAVGDVLQIVAPTSQDATLADIGITILATKV